MLELKKQYLSKRTLSGTKCRQSLTVKERHSIQANILIAGHVIQATIYARTEYVSDKCLCSALSRRATNKNVLSPEFDVRGSDRSQFGIMIEVQGQADVQYITDAV